MRSRANIGLLSIISDRTLVIAQSVFRIAVRGPTQLPPPVVGFVNQKLVP